jgi:hypothetical protein
MFIINKLFLCSLAGRLSSPGYGYGYGYGYGHNYGQYYRDPNQYKKER